MLSRAVTCNCVQNPPQSVDIVMSKMVPSLHYAYKPLAGSVHVPQAAAFIKGSLPGWKLETDDNGIWFSYLIHSLEEHTRAADW